MTSACDSDEAGGAGSGAPATATSTPSTALVLAPGPDVKWSGRLVKLDNSFRVLGTKQAYASTLGGGYFMCRDTSHARRFAAMQLEAAATVGDPKLINGCLLHFFYISVQEGKFDDAKAILRHLRTFREDKGLQTALQAAKAHWRAVVKVARTARGGASQVYNPTEDPFYRQRLLLKDR